MKVIFCCIAFELCVYCALELSSTKITTTTTATIDNRVEIISSVVLIHSNNKIGSGVIIAKKNDQYKVLTAYHVVKDRYKHIIEKVDGLTGRTAYRSIDIGCTVRIKDHEDVFCATIIGENREQDLAMITFKSQYDLPIATIATDDMLNNIDVFDDVVSIGWSLGQYPMPTKGIISQKICIPQNTGNIIRYAHTSQLAPGSSGGGLFVCNDKCYLIGISIGIKYSGDYIFNHLAESISIASAKELINNADLN